MAYDFICKSAQVELWGQPAYQPYQTMTNQQTNCICWYPRTKRTKRMSSATGGQGDRGAAHRALNQLIGSPRPHFCFGCCAGWCAMRPITELSATSLSLKCVCASLGPFPRPSIRHGARCTFPYTRKRIFNLTQAKNCVTDTLLKYYDDWNIEH